MRRLDRSDVRHAAPGPTLLAVLLLPLGIQAQSVEHAPLASQLASSPAALALGGAFPVARPTSDALFAHPAVLTEASGMALSLQSYGEGATYFSASGAREWWSGGAGVGIRAMSYSPADPAPGRVPREGDLFREGAGSVVEIVASAGYARSLFGFRFGVTGAWIERRSGPERDRTVAADVGVATEVGEVTVAVSGRNLGPDLGPDGAESFALPAEAAATGAFRGVTAGPLDLGAAAEVALRADGEVIPGGGLEVAWWPIYGRTFVGRVGARRSAGDGLDPLTLGAAFWGDDIGLEYAWRGAGGSDAIHRFGVRWR